MMTTEQLNQISQYIRESGIKYYDLELEMVDHIAEWITMDMEVNKLTFKTSFERLPDFFSKADLKNIQRSRKKYLSKKYYAIFLNEWQKFFTWPKLTMQIVLIILSTLFFSFIKQKGLIGYYLVQIQFLLILIPVFTYRFREMYKLRHEMDMIQKLLISETISSLGSYLRLPFFLIFILVSTYEILTGKLPIIIYQILVYSYAIQITYMWAVIKTEADSLLKSKDDYPEVFKAA
jgi:hypothetical protein